MCLSEFARVRVKVRFMIVKGRTCRCMWRQEEYSVPVLKNKYIQYYIPQTTWHRPRLPMAREANSKRSSRRQFQRETQTGRTGFQFTACITCTRSGCFGMTTAGFANFRHMLLLEFELGRVGSGLGSADRSVVQSETRERLADLWCPHASLTASHRFTVLLDFSKVCLSKIHSNQLVKGQYKMIPNKFRKWL